MTTHSGLEWMLYIALAVILGPIAWITLAIVWYWQAKTEVEHRCR
jgi:hypothetical protein